MSSPNPLENTPDPFPSLPDPQPTPTSSKVSPRQTPLDTSSQTLFPSLAPASALTVSRQAPALSSWNSASPRIKAPISRAHQFSESFSLADIDLSHTAKDGKRLTLGEVLKDIQARTKTKIEASAQKKETTFYFKADSEKDLATAKRLLIAAVSPNITLRVEAPVSSIGVLIGPKGSTLKQVRDQTNTRIDIPRKETTAINGWHNGNHHSRVASSDSEEEPQEEPTVFITVSGPAPHAHEAKALLIKMIPPKPIRATKQKIKDVPPHILPFIQARLSELRQEGSDVIVKDGIIHIQGGRDAVAKTVETIKSTIQELTAVLVAVMVDISKKQHRLLVGEGALEVLRKTNCAVVVPDFDDDTSYVKIWGRQDDIGQGVSATMQQSSSRHIHSYTLPSPVAHAKLIQTYLIRTNYADSLQTSHPEVEVHVPPVPAISSQETQITVDFVGPKPEVDSAVKALDDLIKSLDGGLREVEVDWLVHKVLLGRFSKKLKQFHETHNALNFFPPDHFESSHILLVYDPSSTATPSTHPAQKQKALDEVQKEVEKLAAEAADVKNETLSIDKKWHAAIVGKGGTTLNAIIGEDRTLSIKVGATAKLGPGQAPLPEDAVLIRGPSAEVDRAVKEIQNIVDKAQNDQIDNGHSIEFDIVREFVGRVVGAHGAGFNKLRDDLGVRVEVSDEGFDEKTDEHTLKKGRKSTPAVPKSKVKIVGRKENVEEAKKRILAQVDKLADETSEVLKIPRQYHSSLIGQSGKYVIRLEEKYGVKIIFPREAGTPSEDHPNGNGRISDKTRENLKLDEVLIRGGRKGVAGAKAEIVEAVEYEKDNNFTIKFAVPTRAVARILGKGGVNITEIKDNTDAQIDLDKAPENNGSTTNVIVRGTKKAAEAAKKAVLAISERVDDEVNVVVHVDSKYHRSIIGTGGQNLRDLIARCGGPTEAKAQAGLIHFPRNGESPNEVHLRGPRDLVKKLQAELDKLSATYKDRIVVGVSIPASQHRALIGRGGQHLTDLQTRTGATVQFPGSRSFVAVGQPENATELVDVNPENLVKVYGPREACEKAIQELTTARVSGPSNSPDIVSSTVSVPLKYYHVISQQGNFFRNLRTFGVTVEHSKQPEKPFAPPRPPVITVPTVPVARIDDDEDTPAPIADVQWQVVPNYQDAEEGDSEWTLKARDKASLERAEKLLAAAVEHAESSSHIGYLTLPDRQAFPRIVGTKGANVTRLRAETGAEITVGRDDNTIAIIGSEKALDAARAAIVQITVSYRPRRA